MSQGPNMIVKRFTEGIDVVVHRKVSVERDTKNFDMTGHWNLTASNVDRSQAAVAGSPLTGAQQDGLRFVRI